MKTGATRQQIEAVAKRVHGERNPSSSWDQMFPLHQKTWIDSVEGWASHLVDENHRIVSVEDLRAIRELAEPDFSTMHADERSMRLVAVLLARIDDLIAGNGE